MSMNETYINVKILITEGGKILSLVFFYLIDTFEFPFNFFLVFGLVGFFCLLYEHGLSAILSNNTVPLY